MAEGPKDKIKEMPKIDMQEANYAHGPIAGTASYPNFKSDQSFEEQRWLYYQAKKGTKVFQQEFDPKVVVDTDVEMQDVEMQIERPEMDQSCSPMDWE